MARVTHEELQRRLEALSDDDLICPSVVDRAEVDVSLAWERRICLAEEAEQRRYDLERSRFVGREVAIEVMASQTEVEEARAELKMKNSWRPRRKRPAKKKFAASRRKPPFKKGKKQK